MTDLPTAAPASRRVPLCLDAAAESKWILVRVAAKAGKASDEQVTEAEQAAAAATVVVELRPLSWPEWQDLLDDHPPRVNGEDKFNRLDLAKGYNRRTFPPALVAAAMTSPHLDAAQWSTLQRSLTVAQFQGLYESAEALAARRTPGDIPFGSAG